MEWIERQKVSVPCNDMGGAARNSEFQEFVVLWIAASFYLHIRINPLRLGCKSRQKNTNIFVINISSEPPSRQNLVEFYEHSRGKQYFSFSEG